MEYLKQDHVLYAGILQVIRRNTYVILEDETDGIHIQDTVSKIFFLTCADREKAFQWFVKHHMPGYAMVTVYDETLSRRIETEYGLTCFMEVYQCEYPNREKLEITSDLTIVQADRSDIPLILSHYDKLEEWEIETIIEQGNLLIGYHDNVPVGFIGCHLEGAIGLLEVFEEYRRHGYGRALEAHMINTLLDRDLLCFGQIEKNNVKSIALQKSKGLVLDDRLQYWLIQEA
ncbi:MAG: GNAT family N-acetyltransferase [Bulleidia sp.]